MLNTTDQTIRKLKEQKSTLRNVDALENIRSLTTNCRDDLLDVLGTTQDFQVTDRTRSELISTTNVITAMPPADGLRKDLVAKRIDIQDQINAIGAITPDVLLSPTYQRLAEEKRKVTSLIQAAGNDLVGNAANMRTDYTNLVNAASLFNVASTVGNIDVNLNILPINRAYGLGVPGIPNINQNLNNIFVPGVPLGNRPTYTLCDSEGTPLEQTGADYTMTIGGETATLSGINLAAGFLDLSNISIRPATIDITQPLKLSIVGRYDDVGGTDINMIHKKDFKLQLRRGVAPTPMNTEGLRLAQFNNYNTIGNHIVERTMSSIYKEKILALEKAAFLSAIGSGAGKLAGLNDKQKEALRKEVRKQYITPGSTYLDIQIPVAGGGPVVLNRIRDLTGPNGFPSWFTSDLHEGSKNKENIASEEAYTKYIDNNLEDQISKYYAHRFDEVFTDNAGANLFLRTQATNYLTKLRKSRADTNLHLKIEGNIDDRPNGRHSLHPKAMNLLVSQEKINITGQSVDINTNAGSESVDTPHPDEYDLDLNISKSNLITAEIKIKGQSAFRLKGAFPSIIRTILSRPEIAHGKTRVHISYNVVRGLIQMAEKRGIDLSYRDENTGHTMVVRLDGDNIVLEEQDDRTNSRTTNKRIPNILFNSQDFKDTNIFDGEENGSLESGIDNLMTHFTQAMNQVHAQRHEVIKKKWMTQTKLPNKFYASPIKRLLNSKKNTNFDFKEEKVTGADGRTADISYTAGVFTIAMEGLKKPVSNKSLGKLLEDEIFIGIDVEIWGKMYETLVNNLRKNEKIANCTFGVADPKTGRVYTIDKDGDFGYYSAETTNPIKRKNVGVIVRKAATTTLLAGAAILTSGIAASIAGVFTFASAMDTGMYLRENTHKNRGIIPESTPTAPVICTEIEKQKILKDPFIMSGLIRAMSERLGRL